jgi:hypothetical protein
MLGYYGQTAISAAGRLEYPQKFKVSAVMIPARITGSGKVFQPKDQISMENIHRYFAWVPRPCQVQSAIRAA